MKKLLTLILLFITTYTIAQKQYQVAKETVFVPGPKVSTIKIVDYFKKQIGAIDTHTSFDNKKAVFTRVDTEANLPAFIVLQVITKDATKGLIPNIKLEKAGINPDEITVPKNYWNIMISFTKANNEEIKVGSTTFYRNEKGVATVKPYLGTSYTVPFATKAAADKFVTSFKTFLK